MATVSTGRFDSQQAVSGAAFNQTSHSYFSGDCISAANYPNGSLDGYNGKSNTPDQNLHEFGFVSQEVVIVNEGSSDIVYQTDAYWGDTKDSGIVKAGQTLYLRKKRIRGLKVKQRTTGTPAYYVMAH